MLQLEDFLAELAAPATGSKLDAILEWAQATRGGGKFEDDISIMELRFG